MFVVVGNDNQRTTERLDTLTGKRKREDPGASILRQAAFDKDRKSLLELLTPTFPSLEKLFKQADCHIKPGTLFGIGMLLAVLGATASWLAGVKWYLAPFIGLLLCGTPWAW